MKNNYCTIIKNCFLLISAVTVMCALLTMDSYSAYTKANKAKRVAATYDDVGARFSSNYMDGYISENLDEVSRKALYVKSDETPAMRTVTVTINNFARGAEGYTYDRSIEYTLTARPVINNAGVLTLADAEDMGDSSITVTIGSATQTFDSTDVTEFSADRTLARGAARTDTCIVTFSSDFISKVQAQSSDPKICLLLKATLPNNTYTDLTNLACLMYFTLDSDVVSNFWDGGFSDSGSDIANGISSGFDGYNYVIEGVGEGTGRLKWNPAYLVLNEESIALLGGNNVTSVTVDGATWSQLEIALDSDNVGRYDIQFFQTSTDRSIYAQWGTITANVRFEAESA